MKSIDTNVNDGQENPQNITKDLQNPPNASQRGTHEETLVETIGQASNKGNNGIDSHGNEKKTKEIDKIIEVYNKKVGIDKYKVQDMDRIEKSSIYPSSSQSIYPSSSQPVPFAPESDVYGSLDADYTKLYNPHLLLLEGQYKQGLQAL